MCREDKESFASVNLSKCSRSALHTCGKGNNVPYHANDLELKLKIQLTEKESLETQNFNQVSTLNVNKSLRYTPTIKDILWKREKEEISMSYWYKDILTFK